MGAVEAIQRFLYMGGPILLVIMVVTFVMWVLILERAWYFWVDHPRAVRQVLDIWHERADRSSWYAKQIRRELLSRLSLQLNRGLGTIKTLVALCPLLGLLGTVTGMIGVFEVMAILGSGNPRAMADGVYKATIPTMAGMVASLSGLYFSVLLERYTRDQLERTADELTEAQGELRES